jgi:hypothetical protein
VIERRSTPAGEFVDRALSHSVTSPGRLGEAAAAAFVAEIRAYVETQAKDGLLAEVVETTALIARRP